MSLTTVPRTTPAGPETAAAWFSALGVLLGVWWWAAPHAYPLAEPDPLSLISGPWRRADSLLLIALGLLGLTTALGMRRAVAPRLLIAGAALQTVVLLGIAADARALTLMGYLLALFGPVILLGVLAAGAWRHPPTRYALAAALVAAGGIALATGAASPAKIASLFAQIAGALPDKGPGLLLVAGTVAAGGAWVWTLVRQIRRAREQCVRCGRPESGWLSRESATRWGRWVTIAAAIGPLPYGLLRMTWLTPWPLFGDREILLAQPEMRLFGVSLGLAAIGGAVLTLGLIRPWGEVFPRWLPVLRDRPVQPALPTAIGMAVGGTVTVAGRSFVQLVVAQPDTWPMLLIFPFPLWGPLLIAASAAYYLRRRGRCPACDQA